VQSTATDVDAYLAEVPAERREVLTAILQLCLALLPGYEESIAYGMPCYIKDGDIEFAFASQKKHISIYGLKSDALAAHRAEFAGASIGKSCIRYTKPKSVDLEAVARLLKATAAFDSRIC
jgi:uncharacterized protein YdhG (YjbR/CyaY superfamily)